MKYIDLFRGNSKLFWKIIILFSCIKQWLILQFPIHPIGEGIHDDVMMVKEAYSMMAGDWLGAYSQMTLVKGIFFPMFLSFSNYIGISYTNFFTIIYTVSCIYFILAIRPLFQKYRELVLIVIFIVLLFNPLTYSEETFQRVYRNGMCLWQLLIIFGSVFAVYLRREQSSLRKLIKWLITGGIALAFFCNTREDAIWIYPFLIFVSFVMVFLKRKEGILRTVFIYLIPFIILCFVNTAISTINYCKYGIFLRNELTQSNFARTIKSIYKIKDSQDIPYVSVSRNKLKKLYEMSPSLNSIKDKVELMMDTWSSNSIIIGKLMNINGEKEVADGWFFWALRDAVQVAGYYKNANLADSFYNAVSEELEEYIATNNIETTFTMPSPLMSPWRDNYFSELPSTIIRAIGVISSFDGCASRNKGGESSDYFEKMTNNRSNENYKKVELSGWIFPELNEELVIYLKDSGGNTTITKPNQESLDIYNVFKKENTLKCRFSIQTQITGDCFMTIRTPSIDTTLPISDGTAGFNEMIVPGITKWLDKCEVQEKNLIMDRYVDRANLISDIYRFLNNFFFIISLILYVLVSVLLFGKKKNSLFEVWLICTSLMLSFIVFVTGVAYTDISAFSSISYFPLAASYILMLMFECIIIGYVACNIKILFHEKTAN